MQNKIKNGGRKRLKLVGSRQEGKKPKDYCAFERTRPLTFTCKYVTISVKENPFNPYSRSTSQ